MIDAEGFRPNVGIILTNPRGQILWARRVGGRDAWQFPQGGIQSNERPEAALYRELYEEVGLTEEDVQILACTRGWLRYRLPRHLIRRQSKPLCIGQKQKWFLLRHTSSDQRIRLDRSATAEFDDWRWVSYWYPLDKVVSFKRDVYRRALKELCIPFCNHQKGLVLNNLGEGNLDEDASGEGDPALVEDQPVATQVRTLLGQRG